MDVFNLAHGEFYMLGAYFSFFAATLVGLDPISSTLVAMMLVFAVGVGVEKGVISRLRGRPGEATNIVVATLGISLFLQNATLMVWGWYHRGRTYFWTGALKIFGISIGYERLVAFMFAVMLIIVFWIFIKRTKVGKAMRAIADNRMGALLAGININRIYMVTFGVAVALAGGAGSILLPMLAVYPTVGSILLLKAFAVVILGGMGSIKGSIFGGFILGVVEALTVWFLGAMYRDIVSFVVVIIILAVRPRGLFGVK